MSDRPSFRRPLFHLLALCVFVLMVLAPPAGAEDAAPITRLDPTLRRLVREPKAAPRILPDAVQRPSRLISVTVLARRDVSADVIGLGGRVNSVVGEEPVVLTARLPIDQLQRLADTPGVTSVSAPESLSTALDESTVDIKADEVWQLQDDGMPIRGQDVLIGIVDTGIDWSHRDFKDARGQSRIVVMWDQTGSGPSPVGFDYGTEWWRWQIDRGFATETDTAGHGTHVAGVAAGSGAHYTGVAPEAELIVVKSLLDTASIIDAWSYIVSKAQQMGRPVVINNSFGAHGGAHDGTADYERALDALAGPGVIFTTAAGNEGQSAIHASGRVPVNESISLPFSFFDDYSKTFADVNIWYEASDNFAVSVTAPTGQTFGPVQRGAISTFGTSDGAEVAVDALSAPWPANGDNWVRVSVYAPYGETVRGDWSITLRGDRVVDGQFDAWLAQGPYDKLFFGYHIDSSVTIREPGTAVQAISAGAYVTKDCWTAADGRRYCDFYTDGELYPHSSRGPTRDGRPRPDVSAPGARVFAPRSSDASVGEAWQLAADGRYEGRVGTSVSAAHLTGVIALMLQVDPALDPAAIRSTLRAAAREDDFTQSGASWQWGAGKLDALAAVRTAQARRINYQYIPLVIRNRDSRPTPLPMPSPTPTRTPRPGPQPSPISGGQ